MFGAPFLFFCIFLSFCIYFRGFEKKQTIYKRIRGKELTLDKLLLILK